MLNPVITLFTQDGCAESAQVRAWLDAREVPFTECNVTGHADHAAALIATGTPATPLTVIGDVHILGFRLVKLEQAIAGACQ